jgi:hypothetical protein
LAREAATTNLARLRDEVRVQLEVATQRLSQSAIDSQAWLSTGEALKTACSRLASAIHCLLEWDEPTDAYVDLDPSRDRSRRDYRRWLL